MQQQSAYTVAVVGATGVVGEEMVAVLAERKFPVRRLVPLASARSLGKTVAWQDDDLPVQTLTPESFAGVDIALFSAGASVSREFAPIAAAAGALVIDNSSAFRTDPAIPLVVPEVNAAACAHWRTRGIVANPNCAAIQICVALHPIAQQFGLALVVATTLQSVSGAGLGAMEELTTQVRALLTGDDPVATELPQVIAFNCIPQIDTFRDDGSTGEEWKIMTETQRILGLPNLAMTATAVRVPVYVGHAASLTVVTQQPATLAALRDCLRQAPGVVLQDDPAVQLYPQQRTAAGSDAVYVGRVRVGHPTATTAALWVVADNLRKGAALNAVQIAELILEKYVA